jgi:predicted molibdopterin-dependent oxidoreductase YjgC
VIEQENRHGATRVGDARGVPVTFTFEGNKIPAQSGDTVASALLAAGVRVFTTTEVAEDARGGFCFVGRCADCLVVIDGQANQRACLTTVRDGMDVRIQHGHSAVERQVGS